MKIIIRSHENTEQEIQLGQKIGFTSIKGIEAISATANLNGLTPLSAIVDYFKFDKRELRKKVEKSSGRVDFIDTWPRLLLVPKTKLTSGRNTRVEAYAVNILKLCNHNDLKELHFTHYGFINGDFQYDEIYRILSIFINPLVYTTLETLYWEIDSRYTKKLFDMYNTVDENFNGARSSMPSHLIAPEIIYSDYINNTNKNYWQQYYGRNF